MPPISDAALEACRHQGYTQTPPQEATNAWLSPNGYIIDEVDLPRPDEDHGDCMRYLLFVVSKGFEVLRAKPGEWSITDPRPRFVYIGKDDNPLVAITAACNAAMRSVAESEGEA